MTEPKLVVRPAFNIIGASTRTNNQDEMQAATAKIPALWQRYFSENIEANIPDKTDSQKRYSVYTDYASDVYGDYTVLLGTEVQNLAQIPSAMAGLTIPSSQYLWFQVEGEMPGAVIQAWQDIWQYFNENTQYQRAYLADFEEYDSNHDRRVDIYISVK